MRLQIRQVPAVLVSFQCVRRRPIEDSFRASAVGITHSVRSCGLLAGRFQD